MTHTLTHTNRDIRIQVFSLTTKTRTTKYIVHLLTYALTHTNREIRIQGFFDDKDDDDDYDDDENVISMMSTTMRVRTSTMIMRFNDINV